MPNLLCLTFSLRLALLALTLSTAWANELDFPAEPIPGTPATQLVPATNEEIVQRHLRWDKLPRTLSVDAFTDEELRRLKIEIYNTLPDSSCVAWEYLDTGKKLQPFGLWLNGFPVLIKVNGRLRRSGGGVVFDFQPVATIAEALIPSPHPPEWKDGEGDLAIALGFGIGKSKPLGVAQCTSMRARCARYESNELNPAWSSRKPTVRNSDDTVSFVGLHVPIDKPATFTPKWIVEDMCPFTRRGVVDGAWKARLWGEAPGKWLYGIRFNASLKHAMSDVASEARAAKKAER